MVPWEIFCAALDLVGERQGGTDLSERIYNIYRYSQWFPSFILPYGKGWQGVYSLPCQPFPTVYSVGSAVSVQLSLAEWEREERT